MENIIVKEDLDIDVSSLDRQINISLLEGERFIYLGNFSKENIISIDIKDNAILHLSIFAKSQIDFLNIIVNIGKNAHLVAYFADFSIIKNNTNVEVNLNDEGANLDWHLASLSSKKDNKSILVSAYHRAKLTFARVDNYGVAKDDSKLLFAGTSHILNGMSKSKTHQNAKIMVFDSNSDAIAKPILKIDENDIEASHAAVVGKISDEHLFYLTSRGLSLDDAKMLITLGYLKPIFRGFNDKKVEEINEIMGGLL